MVETALYFAAIFAGAGIAWGYRAWRAQPVTLSLQSELAALRAQHESAVRELETAQAAGRPAEESWRGETERRATAEERAGRVPDLERQLVERERLCADLGARIASLETRVAEERRAAEEKLALIDQAQARLTDTFRALSADALHKNNQSFLQLATTTLERAQDGARGDLEARRQAIDQLVAPVRESRTKMDGRIGEIERARVSAYAALDEQLRGLVQFHLPRLHQETANLVKALRQPTARGRWGEMQLKRVVEMAGMVEYCDFVEQQTRNSEDGYIRPDLVVRLPGGKQIVVDAKAPVAAYLEAIEAPDEDTRRLRLADHARQVRSHMTSLGRKAYWEQFEPTPEFVVLFLPGEMFFSAALQHDPALIEFGVAECVIPATPTTLIALLRAVAYGWRQEALAKNAQEVADLGKLLHERIAKLGEHWSEVGERLGKAVDAYNRSVVTLESRVLVSARRLRELKVGSGDAEIEAVEPVDRTPRGLQAPEMVGQEGEEE